MRWLWPLCVAAWLAAAPAAYACPNCVRGLAKDGEQTSSAQLAYSASILFMAGMPFAITTFFGVTFWQLSKRRPQETEGSEPWHPSSRS